MQSFPDFQPMFCFRIVCAFEKNPWKEIKISLQDKMVQTLQLKFDAWNPISCIGDTKFQTFKFKLVTP